MKPTFEQIIRAALAITVFFLMLLLLVPVAIVMLLLSFGRLSNFIVEKIAPILAKTSLWILGIRFKTKQFVDPLPVPAVYISNHSSTLDLVTILALGLPRVRFIAKWEFQYNPLFLILGRLTGQVFIKREQSEKAIATLKKTYSRVKRQNLSIFAAPEGSRKHEGIIGTFKKGPFRIAMDLNYPIVPIYFEGNRELVPGDTLLAHKGECTAYIHPPIDTSDWVLENLEEKISEVRRLYLEWAGVEED